jgi:hypothetical protein
MILLAILIVCAALPQHMMTFYETYVDESKTMQTNWSCERLQQVDGPTYKNVYVISRKNMQGDPECAALDDGDPNKCTKYDDKTSCLTNMKNAKVLTPHTCQKDEKQNQQVCQQLRKQLWQCHKVQDDPNKTYYALRRGENKDIECLGYTYEACTPFKSLLECTDSINMIDNDKYLACGEMMYSMYGTDGYRKAGHYCNTYKDVIV